MLKTYFHNNITWYSFLETSSEKFLPLAEELSINSYISEKFLKETNRDKVLILGNNLFLSLYMPSWNGTEWSKQEINVILGDDYVITGTQKKNNGIEKFRENFQQTKKFKKEEEFNNPLVYSFLYLFEKIYEDMIFELSKMNDEVEKIEENIFLGHEKEMVKTISELNKKLIDFGKHIRNHRDTWDIFLDISINFFSKTHSHSTLETIKLSSIKVISEWSYSKEVLHDLRDTNNSLLNAKLSDTTKTFTTIAFLTLPITLFISIISIPTRQKHVFLEHDQDFTLILITSSIILLITLSFSKYKKWW